MPLCKHTSAHEALHTAWAERMIETRKSAMTLVCCSERLFYLSSDMTCDMVLRVLLILYTLILNKVTQDLLQYTTQNLEMTGYMHPNKGKLPSLTLCNGQ